MLPLHRFVPRAGLTAALALVVGVGGSADARPPCPPDDPIAAKQKKMQLVLAELEKKLAELEALTRDKLREGQARLRLEATRSEKAPRRTVLGLAGVSEPAPCPPPPPGLPPRVLGGRVQGGKSLPAPRALTLRRMDGAGGVHVLDLEMPGAGRGGAGGLACCPPAVAPSPTPAKKGGGCCACCAGGCGKAARRAAAPCCGSAAKPRSQPKGKVMWDTTTRPAAGRYYGHENHQRWRAAAKKAAKSRKKAKRKGCCSSCCGTGQGKAPRMRSFRLGGEGASAVDVWVEIEEAEAPSGGGGAVPLPPPVFGAVAVEVKPEDGSPPHRLAPHEFRVYRKDGEGGVYEVDVLEDPVELEESIPDAEHIEMIQLDDGGQARVRLVTPQQAAEIVDLGTGTAPLRIRETPPAKKRQVRKLLGIRDGRPVVYLDFGDDEELEQVIRGAIERAWKRHASGGEADFDAIYWYERDGSGGKTHEYRSQKAPRGTDLRLRWQRRDGDDSPSECAPPARDPRVRDRITDAPAAESAPRVTHRGRVY